MHPYERKDYIIETNDERKLRANYFANLMYAYKMKITRSKYTLINL